jgi:hypothetical protein
MKVIYIFVVLAVAFSLAVGDPQTSGVTSAAPPDFSGAWQLDQSRSTYIESLKLPDIHLVITQSDALLKVTRTVKKGKKEWTQELAYYTDGRGEKNLILYGGDKVSSKSSWSQDKLVSKYALSPHSSATGVYYNQPGTDIWELSRDGQTLTITTETGEIKNLPAFEQDIFKPHKYQKVFKRVQ